MMLMVMYSSLLILLGIEARHITDEDYLDYFFDGNIPESQVLDELLPLDSYQEQCIKEFNLDRETMAYLSSQEFPPEDDLNLQTLFSCSWKKHGYLGENNEVHFDTLEELWTKYLLEEVKHEKDGETIAKLFAKWSVEDCKNATGSSSGQTAIKIHNCIYRRLLEIAKERKSMVSNKTS